MLKAAINDVWIPKLEGLCADLEGRAVELRDTRMLSHTHGQPATPTTLGKEFAVLAYRLKRQLSAARGLAFLGKFNGATGTFSAHVMAYPDVDWMGASQHFREIVRARAQSADDADRAARLYFRSLRSYRAGQHHSDRYQHGYLALPRPQAISARRW